MVARTEKVDGDFCDRRGFEPVLLVVQEVNGFLRAFWDVFLLKTTNESFKIFGKVLQTIMLKNVKVFSKIYF